ncbi:MAG: ATP-dependent DNA helicase RecG, partial [Pseudomonadota bacterium]
MSRPEILFPLFADTTSLPGVGPKIAALLAKSAGPRVIDLLFTPPTGVVDRRFAPGAAAAPPGVVASFIVTILSHDAPRTPRRPHRIVCEDDTGPLTLVYFNARGDWLSKTYPVGARRVVSGRVERFDDAAQIAHPDIVAPAEDADEVLKAEPVYPLTAGLGARQAAKAAAAAVDRAPAPPDWLDPAHKAREAWPDWRDALAALHSPEAAGDLGLETVARRRLAYDELL